MIVLGHTNIGTTQWHAKLGDEAVMRGAGRIACLRAAS